MVKHFFSLRTVRGEGEGRRGELTRCSISNVKIVSVFCSIPFFFGGGGGGEGSQANELLNSRSNF